jgi:rhodanese-related sulfurtransferase
MNFNIEVIGMADIKEITPAETAERMEDEQVEVIDVREDEEVAQGMIQDALHIPLGDIPEAAEKLDKEKEYILVCRSGRRSLNAAKYLEEQGFKALNMSGGMLKWEGNVKK